MRVGFFFLGSFLGNSKCVPLAKPMQFVRHGHNPQAGFLGVQIVAPKSMMACA